MTNAVKPPGVCLLMAFALRCGAADEEMAEACVHLALQGRQYDRITLINSVAVLDAIEAAVKEATGRGGVVEPGSQDDGDDGA